MLGMGMKTINNTILKIAMGLSWLQPRHFLLAIGDSSVVEVNVRETCNGNHIGLRSELCLAIAVFFEV